MQKGNRKRWKTFWLILVFILMTCSCNALKPRPSISDFKQLPRAVGDDLMGYSEVNKAASATDVVVRFGNPSKTEESNNLLVGNRKVYYYDAKDEFGNPCLARLVFAKGLTKNKLYKFYVPRGSIEQSHSP